ncbi:MAG: NAD(P)/FAD-dependent oxidoreductase [Mobiluncus sp.]|uniref:NAD(P)/FAD-dependent oxidoreductase n=1 Tax=Mobiluncus sp. TaxID=47293 RepID=UPI00258AACC0|nr:FAD/NAD(P)-binding oxidoreductase [Mobiluncus sp.]MCI6585226.1 NAD(P)/FAD-dependent oxidoreductase [Mobiluncus sp.]
MARVVVLGAGIAGHTAAMHLRRKLSRHKHEVVVVSPRADWNWVPSNIWVGTGKMKKKEVVFPLAPLYKRKGVIFHQAAAKIIYPEGRGDDPKPQVEIEFTGGKNEGRRALVHYDYLINATGPLLNFKATPGLGPDAGNSYSVCTADHAEQTGKAFQEIVAAMKEMPEGAPKKRFLIGTGNGSCTCQGAAFEYCFNTEYDLRQAGVRDKAEVVYITNEAQLGDFGMNGMMFKDNGYATDSQLWTESLFRERGVKAITGAGVREVRKNDLTWEDFDGNMHELPFDFAMLLPPFSGIPLEAKKADGTDIPEMFNAGGFMKVDGDYSPKSPEEWSHKDWPKTYQSPLYPNIFAAGIAFAPPHGISKPHKTPNGTNITPAPPRTGMPSGSIGKEVAMSIVDLINKGPNAKLHEASMAVLGAACVASTGTGFKKGSAAAMVMFPIVPNFDEYPENAGRHPNLSFGKIGLFGHWTKFLLHVGFIYKAKWKPFWWIIPE